MFRQSLAASLLLAAATTAFAQVDTSDLPRAKPPAVLQGGVQQNENPADAPINPTTDDNWELQARSQASEQEEAEAGTFMGNPLTFRVTSVGDTDKSGGTQKITALPIHSVTISPDGSVDLGQLVDGSGDTFFVPPGTLQKGDLFTRIQNQYIKLPANHFDPMGALANQVNTPTPIDNPSNLNNLANQLATATDAYKNNAANFTNDFLLAAGNVMGNTLQFLAQPRGDFGQPGQPLQQILNYLNNDNNENNAQLGEAAQQAMQTLATHPGTVAGNLFMAMLPAGQLGKESEIAQISQATQRLTALENTATEFSTLEQNLPPSQLQNLNLKQVAQKAFPNGTTTPPRIQPSPEAIKQFPKQWGNPNNIYPPGTSAPPAGLPDAPTAPPAGAPTSPTVPTPSGGGTVRTPGAIPAAGGGDTVPTPAPNSPLQSRNIPTSPRTPQKAIPMTPAQRQALQDNLKKLNAALNQDAEWTGTPLQAAPSNAPASSDIINTLQSKFGNSPQDPLQGAPGLLESRFGIPTPATASSITNSLLTAGQHSQGLIFSQNPDHSLNILNARNNQNQIEFLDPSTEKRAAPPQNSPLYFYRTQ